MQNSKFIFCLHDVCNSNWCESSRPSFAYLLYVYSFADTPGFKYFSFSKLLHVVDKGRSSILTSRASRATNA
jgi:hypothetical protein